MPKTENNRKYTAPERLFHRVLGALGKNLEQVNEQHRNDSQRVGGIPVKVPPGSFEIGTRKVKAKLNKLSQEEQQVIREFLESILDDSLDATDRDD